VEDVLRLIAQREIERRTQLEQREEDKWQERQAKQHLARPTLRAPGAHARRGLGQNGLRAVPVRIAS